MTSIEKNGQSSPYDPGFRVNIVGAIGIQNELLAAFISKETGCPCLTIPPENLNPPPGQASGGKQLWLIDCAGLKNPSTWKKILKKNSAVFENGLIALMNVDPDTGVEKEAVQHGIRGVFYRNDQREIFVKGIQETLSGELWYSRKVMTDLLLKRGSFNTLFQTANSSLTFREKEILVGIASGMSNKELASEMGISLHTVKTHIYNIYKKINVPNRLQAALWAAKYL